MNAFYWRDTMPSIAAGDWNNGRRNGEEVSKLIDRVVVLHHSGVHPHEIAKTLGITIRYTQQLRARAGLPPISVGRPPMKQRSKP